MVWKSAAHASFCISEKLKKKFLSFQVKINVNMAVKNKKFQNEKVD
jgi:hypothetical protein